MPEHDDKREVQPHKRDAGDRRFWRSLTSDKQSASRTGDSMSAADSNAEGGDADPQHLDAPATSSASHKGPDAVDLTPGDDQRLNPEEQAARREALRSMLHRSEARHRNVRRKRRPVLTAGSKVRVASGPHVGEEGTILDADYIESRVLLSLGNKQTPTWVSFDQVAGPSRKN